MRKEISKWTLFWVIAAFFASQIQSIYFFYKLAQIYDALNRTHVEIIPTEYPNQTDVEFVERLKKNKGFSQEIRIVIGPYRKLFGNSDFRYRLEKHLVFVEQPEATKETFLILFDKAFYRELDGEWRKGVLAHEIWHIFGLANGTVNPGVSEEIEADNYAALYVSADTMINLCKKYEGDESLKNIRISNLERLLRPTRVS